MAEITDMDSSKAKDSIPETTEDLIATIAAAEAAAAEVTTAEIIAETIVKETTAKEITSVMCLAVISIAQRLIHLNSMRSTSSRTVCNPIPPIIVKIKDRPNTLTTSNTSSISSSSSRATLEAAVTKVPIARSRCDNNRTIVPLC